MPERMSWQVRHIYPLDEETLGDLWDWEPFASTPVGGILVRRQTMIEGEKSSVGHELSFAQRFRDDNDPED